MTYSEYFEIAKTQSWKSIPCHSGTDCWCRIITTVEPILDNEEELHLTTWGSVCKDAAEYIVELHNKSLSK